MKTEIKHILCPLLCPLDLSVEIEGALKNALDFARKLRAKLSVCLCASELSQATNAGLRRRRRGELEDLIKGAMGLFDSNEAEDAKIVWESSFVESGTSAAQGIVNEAECRRADLIIMHSRRHRSGPSPPALVCSVSEDVCRAAPCPVLVVNPRQPRRENPSIKRILVAYDFSDYAELALQNAVAFAQAYGAELHLLHIISESARHSSELGWSDRTVNYLYHQTNERLQKALPPPARKLHKLLTPVRWGKPYREILAYAEEHDIDLTAMGAHGADFGLSALFGSNADRVLRQAPGAFLVARPLKFLFNNCKETFDRKRREN